MLTRSYRVTAKADRRVAERRESAAHHWRELKGALNSETGAHAETPAWWVAILGLAFGLELARRMLGPKA